MGDNRLSTEVRTRLEHEGIAESEIALLERRFGELEIEIVREDVGDDGVLVTLWTSRRDGQWVPEGIHQENAQPVYEAIQRLLGVHGSRAYEDEAWDKFRGWFDRQGYDLTFTQVGQEWRAPFTPKNETQGTAAYGVGNTRLAAASDAVERFKRASA